MTLDSQVEFGAAPGGAARTPGTDWPQLLDAALGRGKVGSFGAARLMRTFFQPIVDVGRGIVVGYEALTRFSAFDEESGIGPREWFAAARAHGVGPDLEAAALVAALSRRRDLPLRCFMSVNVSPDMIAHPVVRAVLDEARDLHGVVIELAEQSRVDSFGAIEPVLDYYRRAGAEIAVDDVGASQSGLKCVMTLRPSIIKLDRSVVVGIGDDARCRELVEMVATYAGRIDASLLGEGVERHEELVALREMGVPMAQGFLFGRPEPRWAKVPQALLNQIRDGGPDGTDESHVSAEVRTNGADTTNGSGHGYDTAPGAVVTAPPPPSPEAIAAYVATHTPPDAFGVGLLPASARTSVAAGAPTLSTLLESAPSVSALEHARALIEHDPSLENVVLVDAQHRPVALVTADQASRPHFPPVVAMPAATEVPEAASRAMVRERQGRFQPIVCTDELGRYVGIVTLERLIQRLAGR